MLICCSRVRDGLQETPWRPPQRSRWEGTLFPVAKQPMRFLSPAQWLLAARLFTHFLWQSGALPADPADGVMRLPVGPRRSRGLTVMDAEALLLAAGLAADRRQSAVSTALALRDRAVLALLYREAVSPLELRAAKVTPSSLACGEVYTRPRGSQGRRIRLSPDTEAYVRAYLDCGRPQRHQAPPFSFR